MKRCLKRLANLAAALIVLPVVVLYQLSCLLLGPEQAFPGYSQALALLPGLTGVIIRRSFYRRVLSQCGGDVCVSFGTILSDPGTCLGDRVYVGAYCTLGRVVVEDEVLIASHVSILNGARQHGIDRLDEPIRDQPGDWPLIRVGRNSWIGERVVVMADVGCQSVVGAGSVVAKPVPDRAVVMGVPARVLRFRGDETSAAAS
jgi:acetyltransferase-like isoleucine patch superfamily enzyme